LPRPQMPNALIKTAHLSDLIMVECLSVQDTLRHEIKG
jgi:hypothetical protein